MEAAIPSPDPELEATVAVQAAVIAELRAANAEQARLIVTLQARLAELERRLGKDSSNRSRADNYGQRQGGFDLRGVLPSQVTTLPDLALGARGRPWSYEMTLLCLAGRCAAGRGGPESE